MYWDSVLTSVIQVAIAIAGFSGIVVVLGRRTEGVWDANDRIRFQGLLIGSFATMLFAFLPYILLSANIAQGPTWRISSGIHAITLSVVAIIRRRQLTATDSRLSGSDVVALSVVAAVVAIQVVNSMTVGESWPYLTGIIGHLLVTFVHFVRLLLDYRGER